MITERNTHWTLIEFKDSAAGVNAEREKGVVPVVCAWLDSDPANAKSHDQCHYYVEDSAGDIGFWGYRSVVCSRLPLPASPDFWSENFISSLFATPPGVGLNSDDFLAYAEALLWHTTTGGDGGQGVVLVIARSPESCHHIRLSLRELVSAFSPPAGPSFKF